MIRVADYPWVLWFVPLAVLIGAKHAEAAGLF